MPEGEMRAKWNETETIFSQNNLWRKDDNIDDWFQAIILINVTRRLGVKSESSESRRAQILVGTVNRLTPLTLHLSTPLSYPFESLIFW